MTWESCAAVVVKHMADRLRVWPPSIDKTTVDADKPPSPQLQQYLTEFNPGDVHTKNLWYMSPVGTRIDWIDDFASQGWLYRHKRLFAAYLAQDELTAEKLLKGEAKATNVDDEMEAFCETVQMTNWHIGCYGSDSEEEVSFFSL